MSLRRPKRSEVHTCGKHGTGAYIPGAPSLKKIAIVLRYFTRTARRIASGEWWGTAERYEKKKEGWIKGQTKTA